MAYQSAIDIYLSVLDKHDDSQAKIKIAECYRKLGNWNEMEYWYGHVVLLSNSDPMAKLYYAQALQANEKYPQAKKWVELFLKENPGHLQGQLLLKACNENVVQNLRASGALYKIEHVKELNTDKDEFCAIFYKEDRLVFVSNRDDNKSPTVRTNAWDSKSFTGLYFSKIKLTDPATMKYSYTKPEKFSKSLNSKYHDGPASFNPDGTEVYFSSNNREGRSQDDIVRLKIYRATGSDEAWGEPKGLTVNSDDYSVLHPSLSAKGDMLFFASNMPGGFGGMDLYVSYMEGGNWSPPVNLGPSVNTEGDEVFPFIHEDGTLYFASNGLTGLGGFDIYLSKENYGTWLEPTNLGYPINTVSDDFGIILNKQKTHGYFSSNRNGGKGGDDIYTFTKLSVEVEVLVSDALTGMPIEGAEVVSSCSAVKSFTTNADGKVLMEIALDKTCDFAAEKNPYKPNSVRKSTKDLTPGELLVVQIPLQVEKVYDVVGKVIDGRTNESLGGVIVTLISVCDNERDSLVTSTSNDGQLEFKEIREECDYLVRFRKLGYIDAVLTFSPSKIYKDSTDTIKLNMAMFCTDGECGNPTPDPNPNPNCITCPPVPITDDCKTVIGKDKQKYIICNNDTTARITPDGDTVYNKPRPNVGPKELVNIYYDFDDASIREDAMPELNRLILFLEEYPNAKILITSHTDARGSKMYNRRLSNRRAESVVRYLIQYGISKKRLKAKGMGEDVMINDCYDGVDCTEEQHQENRRTEFQVYEYEGGDLKSRRPATINTNPCKNCPTKAEIEGEKAPEGEPTPVTDDVINQ